MIRIAFTPYYPHENEVDAIIAILDHGWDRIHLRHPDADENSIRNIIERIPGSFHPRIKLHSHFHLACEYGLGGIHLNARNPDMPAGYNGAWSCSCHNISDISHHTEAEYATLSPIFDSISKSGYNAAFTPNELDGIRQISSPRVIALGGITPEKAELVAQYGFAGYAVLGYMSDAYGNIPELERRLAEFDLKI
ncbi:MAG: thiamine phosphate synthase [Muribaculaceae bacterium]|nr:thiamine phosphate synthase [Muribaculaceae bacterium]